MNDIFIKSNNFMIKFNTLGSGKTFTITGGPDRYEDRGIIPRSLSLIYSTIAEKSDVNYNVYIR